MNAIIYTRFSPRKNASTAESCETQESQCREYAQARGWTVKAVHADRAVSGRDADRPGLAAAVADLRRGDTLLVYNRDRMSRSVLIAELTRRQVRDVGASIAAVSGDIDGDDSDPTVVFTRQIMDAVAELARKQIARKTSDAMLQHQRNGRRMSRHAPYGWHTHPRDPTQWEWDYPEHSIISLVKELAHIGHSVGVIRRNLEDNHPDAARTPPWTYNAVKRILKREGLLK